MTEAGAVLQSRYRIEKQIGQGGMGRVYVAVDERFKSRVAIKETIFEDANLRRAFEREARLLNSLKHPALPRVSDYFNDGDGQFLVMEYIAGEDLAETLERSGAPFPLGAVLSWAEQLCGALEYLHRQNIIYRDIKPQNLKLTHGGHVVLLDFGLAKGNATDSPHQTAVKSIFGYSRSYASLEQIQGAGTEPRSDLYALGATLYHLLTGEAPADALTRAMNVLNGQADPLTTPDLLNKNIPFEVSQILIKTMALNAGERPASAAALRSMLEACDKNAFREESSARRVPAISSADLSAQNTKLFGAPTNLESFGQSTVKTLISGGNAVADNSEYATSLESESVITKQSPPAQNTKNRPRPQTISVVVAVGLLLVATGVFAAFLYNPAGITTNSNHGDASAETRNDFVNREQNAAAPANANAASAAANEKTDAAAAVSKPTAATAKSAPAETAGSRNRETKAAPEKSSATRQKATKNPAEDDLVINEDSIETGGMIFDENGIRMKNQPPRTPRSPAAPTDLTPAQIERLKRLGSRKPRVVFAETPEPEN